MKKAKDGGTPFFSFQERPGNVIHPDEMARRRVRRFGSGEGEAKPAPFLFRRPPAVSIRAEARIVNLEILFSGKKRIHHPGMLVVSRTTDDFRPPEGKGVEAADIGPQRVPVNKAPLLITEGAWERTARDISQAAFLVAREQFIFGNLQVPGDRLQVLRGHHGRIGPAAGAALAANEGDEEIKTGELDLREERFLYIRPLV
jgi:hypothetical protein